ncbi:MAG: SWIM zinc finger family protein [Saprospiraceae bacterium]
MRVLVPLLKLDSLFDENIYIEGEELYDNSGIEKVMELYKGKVMMVMKDGNKSELRFNKDNIVDINCSCQDFKIQKVCKHVVASSFEVRKLASKIEDKVIKRRTTVRKKGNDLFSEILKTLDKSELSGFLTNYAQKDKNFRLLFEAFFLNRLRNKELDNPYGKLLDEVLPPSTEASAKFSRQQISLLIDISKDLLNRFKDEISLKKYTDAFNLIKHLINKLSYASNVSNNEHLLQLMKEAHNSLIMNFEGEVAPELKQKQYEFIYEMIGKSYYYYQDDSDLIHLFISTKPLHDDLVHFLGALKEKLNITRDDEARKYFMAFYIGLKKQIQELESDWYETNFTDLSHFMDIALVMINEGFHEELDNLLTELYSKEKISKRLYLESQLRISISSADCERVGYLILSIYESTQDFRFIKRTYRCIPEFPLDVVSKLSEIIKNSAEEEDVLSWYVMINDFDSLISYLSDKNDITLIQIHELEIFEHNPQSLQTLYKNYIYDYLDNHFGEKSVNVVKNLLMHLRSIGAKKQAFEIEKDIFEVYSSRKSLLRNLM